MMQSSSSYYAVHCHIGFVKYVNSSYPNPIPKDCMNDNIDKGSCILHHIHTEIYYVNYMIAPPCTSHDSSARKHDEIYAQKGRNDLNLEGWIHIHFNIYLNIQLKHTEM